MQPSHRAIWPAILLALIVLATALRPGDAPWIFDEPLLMNGALFYNAKPCRLGPIFLPFTPAVTGLQGTRGVRYGPLAVWIDQIFLAFTHDPESMIAIRASVFASVNALALFWLCKTFKFSPWLAVVVMLSPWLWFYARQLWDNSLCIPFSALLVAAYADFLSRRRAVSFFLAVFCAMMLLLLHLMSVALIAAFVAHLIIFESRSLAKHKWPLVSMILIVVTASSPYWNFLLHNFHRDIPPDSSTLIGWLYPLLGAHHISGAGLGNIFGSNWQSRATLVAQRISLLAYAAVWTGMILALPPIRRVLRSSQPAATDHILCIAWLAVILQSILDGIQQISDGPQYYNATWIVFALFALSAVNRLFELPRLPKIVPGSLLILFAGSLVVITLTLAVTIHRNAGMRTDNYGTSLSNQIAAAREIQQYSVASTRQIDYPQWQNYPIALTVLQELIPAPPGPRSSRGILISYRNAFPGDAAILVIPQSP